LTYFEILIIFSVVSVSELRRRSSQNLLAQYQTDDKYVGDDIMIEQEKERTRRLRLENERFEIENEEKRIENEQKRIALRERRLEVEKEEEKRERKKLKKSKKDKGSN
jgi:hypothetical protein